MDGGWGFSRPAARHGGGGGRGARLHRDERDGAPRSIDGFRNPSHRRKASARPEGFRRTATRGARLCENSLARGKGRVRTSHADEGFLAREIGDVLRSRAGGRVRRQSACAVSRVLRCSEQTAPAASTGVSSGMRTTKVSLNDAKMCATPNTCSPSRGLGMWGLTSSTTGAATFSSSSACANRRRCGCRG